MGLMQLWHFNVSFAADALCGAAVWPHGVLWTDSPLIGARGHLLFSWCHSFRLWCRSTVCLLRWTSSPRKR